MVKIKTIKKLNLPQLIEYTWDNGVRNVTFRGLDKKGYVVSISINDKGEFSSDWRISKNVIFTVEVEEKITENTVLPKLVERWKHDDEGDETFRYVEHDDKSINRVLFANPESVEATHFYIENDNRELVLIWRNGNLVE